MCGRPLRCRCGEHCSTRSSAAPHIMYRDVAQVARYVPVLLCGAVCLNAAAPGLCTPCFCHLGGLQAPVSVLTLHHGRNGLQLLLAELLKVLGSHCTQAGAQAYTGEQYTQPQGGEPTTAVRGQTMQCRIMTPEQSGPGGISGALHLPAPRGTWAHGTAHGFRPGHAGERKRPVARVRMRRSRETLCLLLAVNSTHMPGPNAPHVQSATQVHSVYRVAHLVSPTRPPARPPTCCGSPSSRVRQPERRAGRLHNE